MAAAGMMQLCDKPLGIDVQARNLKRERSSNFAKVPETERNQLDWYDILLRQD